MKKFSQKIRTGSLLLGFLSGIFVTSAVGAWDADTEFRGQFPNIVRELCHSGISYSVDDSVASDWGDESWKKLEMGGKAQEYHRRINCLFNDAFALTSKAIKEEAETAFGKGTVEDIPTLELFSDADVSQCENVGNNEPGEYLGKIRSEQKESGFQDSQCARGDDFPNLKEEYSPCRVAEMALIEFCGYQKFLWAKMNDQRSFVEESRDRTLKTSSFGNSWEEARARYQDELNRSERGLLDSLELYRNFEQSYRVHAWLRAIIAELEKTQSDKLGWMRNAISTFPDKFIDQMTP